MAINEQPCGSCQHYDPIILGDDRRKGTQGWCAVTSVYPAQAQQGQIFPTGVKRAAVGVLASPTIVTMTEVVAFCPYFRAKP